MTPSVAAPRLVSVHACIVKACPWESPDAETTPRDVLEELIAGHLLADHRDLVAAVGRLADDADLL